MDSLINIISDTATSIIPFVLVILVLCGLAILLVVIRTKKLLKKHSSAKEIIKISLKDNNFNANEHFEFVCFYKKHDYSIDFLVDSENKRIAIASYENEKVTYYKFSELLKLEIFQGNTNIGSSLPNNINNEANIENLKLVIHTKNAKVPVYTIKLTFSENKNNRSASISTPAQFARNVSSAINAILG